jgi:uncharacterized membrane protein YdjX (TVP38/TMEM64 family)
MKKPTKGIIWLNLLLLTLFFVVMTYLTIKFAPQVTHLIKKPDRFRDLLASYGPISILVFIFFQIMQVVIAAIPGELVQLAGGYVYGTVFGTIYSTIGILLGSVIAFYISRILGFTLVKNFVSQKDLEKFTFLINSPKSEITMFLLFLIPGIPKDTLVYIAGFTPIKPRLFFVICTIARFPGILASSFIGANIQERDYLPVIVVSAIACVVFIIGLLKKEAIISKLSHLLHPKLFPRKKS